MKDTENELSNAAALFTVIAAPPAVVVNDGDGVR